MMPGGKRRNIGHLDTHALEAEAARMGKQLHPRVEPKTETGPGRLVWVLDAELFDEDILVAVVTANGPIRLARKMRRAQRRLGITKATVL